MKNIERKKLKPALILIVLIHLIIPNKIFAQNQIQNFKIFFATGIYKHSSVIILRSYKQQNQNYFFVVNPNNLKTSIIAQKQISYIELTWQQIKINFRNTAYIRAIDTAVKHDISLENSGITHGSTDENGVVLSVDLCPSEKPMDRIIFTTIINDLKNIQKPVPVAVSISGRFLIGHLDDIDWLKKISDSGNLSITWINHTYNHYYSHTAQLCKNFLLAPNTNLNYEILANEKLMLEHNLIFSVFFRFPGLVSDSSLIKEVTDYGLIPVGSNAWLAKGHKPVNGSIVLIHGNGNEPLGVKDLERLLQADKSIIINNKWRLYDLKESISNEFKN